MVQPAKKTAKKAPVPDAEVSVLDLPDARSAQITEAMEEPVPIALRDGTTVTFRPVADWPFLATQAFMTGDLVTWMRGALADEADLDRLLAQSQRDVGRILRYFDDKQGVARGEADSSSQS